MPSSRSEDPRHVLGTLVDDRSHEVTRRLVVELEDVLPQVCLDDVDSGRFQRVVESDFLGEHGLGFDGAPHPATPGDVHHGVARL